jgi:hypothetical protein
MCRVLRPGGIAAIATEFVVEGPGDIFLPETIMFDEATLRTGIVEAADWRLVAPLHLGLSTTTRNAPADFMEVLKRAERDEPQPHLLLRHEQTSWTSVSLVLRRN